MKHAVAPDRLAAWTAGDPVAWGELHLTVDEVLDWCRRHELTSLVHARVERSVELGWPGELRDRLADEVRLEAVREAVRRREIRSVLASLDACDIHPILIKGAALAYTTYPSPSARPRADTDV